jgi:cell division GTPase FtsZ
MTVNTENVTVEETKIIDDITKEDPILTALKNKMSAKQESNKDMTIKIVDKKKISIELGIIGSGQAGSRLAETFYKKGYPAVVINTAPQDLEFIKIPENNKLLLKYGLGGASKDLSIGASAAEQYKDSINELVATKLSDTQVFIFCTSLGGGSGAGSIDTIIDVLSATSKPIVVLAILPMSAEDSKAKSNALESLSKLANAAQNKKIQNIILIDNAKVETIFADVSPNHFFEVSNEAIVNPIDIFNTLSSKPSNVKPLDPMEYLKVLIDGGSLSVYGQIDVTNYTEATSIAEGVINNLNSGLLAEGFNLKDSKYVGIIMVARKNVWDKTPQLAINYALSIIGENSGSPEGIFHGVYESEDVEDDIIRVYSFFSGLGLPELRVAQLKKDAAAFVESSKNKDVSRNLNLKLDNHTDSVTSAAEKIRAQISQKKSAFGTLLTATVDKRK